MSHPGFVPPTSKTPVHYRRTFRTLWRYVSAYRFHLYAIAALSLLTILGSMINPKILGRATTAVFDGANQKIQGTGGIDFQLISRSLLLLGCILLVSTAAKMISGLLGARISTRLCRALREDISRKIHRLPMRYFEKHPIGDTMSRISDDVDQVEDFAGEITKLLSNVLIVVGAVAMMLSISVLMTLIALVIVPLSALLIAMVFSLSRRYFKERTEKTAQMTAKVEESYAGHSMVQAFNREEGTKADFRIISDALYACGWKAAFLSGLMHPIMRLVNNFSYVAVVVSGAYFASRGQVTVGDILAFTQYVSWFTQPLLSFAQMSSSFQRMMAAAEHIFEFLDEPEEDDETGLSDFAVQEGGVVFENLNFGYHPAQPVLKEFSLTVSPGQVCAIVGPTGAGKTTLIKLLMRFYDPDAGRILLDGRDIRTIRRGDLRRSISMVLQDTWLFSGTIMDNIRYGRPDAADEDVIRAAEAAYADHFIRTLPGGYQFQLNEETDNISEGQKQLLTIARAFLADRPLLVLDEATSSVDTATEKRIQDAMGRLRSGRTSFVIAHRLSTIRDADMILVMRDGQIVEIGTHDTLLKAGGYYAELYESQFSEEIS